MLSELVAKLRKSGWRLVNNGASKFGAVLRNLAKEYLIKFYSSADRAYTAFVDLAKANPNPRFPRFYNVLQQWRDFDLVCVEQLSLPKSSTMRFCHLTDLYMYTKDDRLADPAWQNIQTARAYVEQRGPDLKQACHLIAIHLLGTFDLDLEAKNNVLIRGDIFVFADPAADALD